MPPVDQQTDEHRFDTILASPVTLPDDLPVTSFARLIFAPRSGEDDTAPVILGAVESGPAAVSLRHLRHGTLWVVRHLTARGIGPGDTVCRPARAGGPSWFAVARARSCASCASCDAAGMFAPAVLGGRSLCLLLCHSMGVRAFWNAIWTREAICLIHPEWFEERPERVRALLLQMRPEHVTGGPAVFRTLLALARLYPQLKTDCVRDLRSATGTTCSISA